MPKCHSKDGSDDWRRQLSPGRRQGQAKLLVFEKASRHQQLPERPVLARALNHGISFLSSWSAPWFWHARARGPNCLLGAGLAAIAPCPLWRLPCGYSHRLARDSSLLKGRSLCPHVSQPTWYKAQLPLQDAACVGCFQSLLPRVTA